MQDLRNKYLAIIWKGIIKKKPKREIHKELYRMTINNKKVPSVKFLYANATNVLNKAKKIDYDVFPIMFLDMMFKGEKQEFSKGEHIINQRVKQEMNHQKQDAIDISIEQNRKDGKFFYIASRHGDCAEDHKKAQGKLYIDEDWVKYDKYKTISAWLEGKTFKTLQWVLGEPTYFITRPYCRHYLVALTLDEVMFHKYTIPTTTIGDRKFQTPKGYTTEQYEEKLKALKEMYKAQPTPELKALILKYEKIIEYRKKMGE